MDSSATGPEITRLIQLMARLPGLGPRSARRAALHAIKNKETLLAPLARALAEAVESVRTCTLCHNVDTMDPCGVCTDPRRDKSVIVVVEEVGDLWALERASAINGLYHVLGGVLSPLDGIGPEDLGLDGLVRRAHESQVREVILAVNATIEGQSTAHYIGEQLAGAGVRLSRLAHGVPVGGELDYLDDGTLAAAIRRRTDF